MRLRDADRADLGSRARGRQVLLFLLVGAAMGDVRNRHVAVHGERRSDAAKGRSRELFAQHHGCQRTQPATTVFDGVPHAQESHLAELAEHLARDLARSFPGIAVRNDPFIDETAHLLAHHSQVLVQDVRLVEFEFGHGVQVV